MVTIIHEETWGRDDAKGLENVTDMEIVSIGRDTYLYTIDASDGTITSYDITGGQEADYVNRRTVTDAPRSPAQTIDVIENDGQYVLLTAGPTTGEMRAYDINESNGAVLSPTDAFAPGQDLGSVSAIAVYERAGREYLAAAEVDGTLSSLDQTPGGMRATAAIRGGDTYLEDVSAIEFVRGPFGHYVFAASGSEDGITVTRGAAGGRLTRYETLDSDDGLWISAISDLATIDSLGQDYLLVADQGTGSVHSVRIDPDGTMVVTDAIYDNLDTRYGGVSAMEAFSVRHRDYVAVGGSDGGITIIEVFNDGTLHQVATLVDDGTASLGSITDIEVVMSGHSGSLFVSSSGDGGFSQFTLDFGGMGTHRVASDEGGLLGGSNRDDLLTGGDGDDDLYGNAGDDVIYDGAGEDYISGALGADIFVMAYDGDDDVIVRFEEGVDKIDLSDWPLVYDVDRLKITPYDAGVRISYYDENLRIVSVDRTPITTLSDEDFIFA